MTKNKLSLACVGEGKDRFLSLLIFVD